MGETKMRIGSIVRRTAASAALLVAGLGLAPGAARADSDSATRALGFQTEHADVVIVGVIDDAGDAWDTSAEYVMLTYAVETVVVGDVGDETNVVVTMPRLAVAGLREAPESHLLFLARTQEEPPRYRLLFGPSSLRPLAADGAGSRLPDLVARYAAALSLPEALRGAALREELVTQIADEDDGVAWSGATDLFRRAELVEGLSTEQSGRIVAAFAGSEPKGRVTEALALVVAICGDTGAADALADAVASDGAEAIKGGLGDAAEVLGGDALAAELIERLESADPARHVALVSVLGRIGLAPAALHVLPLVRSDDPALRQEALHACGRIARNVRRLAARQRRLAARTPARTPAPPVVPDEPVVPPEPDAPELPELPEKPDVVDDTVVAPSVSWEDVRSRLRVELSRVALRAREPNDKRASLWALAQLDDPAAYAFLRDLAEETEDDFVRRHALSYLERPRQSLILR